MTKRPWLTPSVPPPASTTKPGRPLLRRDHPCATAFLDETGAIAQDRFFAIGLLKCTEPAILLRGIQKLRDRTHIYDEIKFTNTTSGRAPFYERVVDVVCAVPGIEYFCFVADRHKADPVARFGSQWDAYAKLAEQLLVASIHPDELIAVMADNYSTPDAVLFEEGLRSAVNRRLGRLAVVSVARLARLDSRSSDGLQVVDLLTSAIAFEFRANAGLASVKSPKAQLSAYVRSSLGAKSCLKGWRKGPHSVQIYKG